MAADRYDPAKFCHWRMTRPVRENRHEHPEDDSEEKLESSEAMETYLDRRGVLRLARAR